ncbi:MAG: hypothetical protein QM731_10075 [Chitinophagaceae bacterium]
MLRTENISVKPDDYIEMLKIVEQTGSDNIHQLKYRLCPLIVTNEEEQAKFYTIFDKYVQLNKIDEEGEPIKEPVPPTENIKRAIRAYWIYISLVALLITALLIYFLTRPVYPEYAANFIANKPNNQFITGDTIQLDAASTFNNLPLDTTKAHISWNTGEGWTFTDQSQINLPVTAEKILYVSLKVNSGKQFQHESVFTDSFPVCTYSLTGLAVEPNNSLPSKGDKVVLKAVFRGTPPAALLQWSVNDRPLIATGDSIVFSFDSVGDYNIKASAGDCFAATKSVEQQFSIKESGNNYLLQTLQSGAAITPATRMRKWLLWTLIALPLIALLTAYLLHKRVKKQAQKPVIQDPPPPPNKPPYTVPLENKDLQLVARERDMNLLFRAMRSRTEDESSILNIPRSIRSVIKSGGVPTLVFTNKLRHQEYLVLIDKTNAKSQQLFLFEYLLKLVEQENIGVERFYYTRFDNFFNDNFRTGISLQRLYELYPSHIVIIMGSGHQLFEPATAIPDQEKLDTLKEWEGKAILTPIPYKDWLTKEKILGKQLVILPADIQGQVLLMQAIREKQLQHSNYLSSVPEFYEAGMYYFTDVADIKEYLNDDDLFQWLCAICVYPRVRWEIMIEVGNALFNAAGKPGKLNFSSLLKLVRIQWMKEGVFPEHTRLQLLKQLTVSNELLARKTVLEMLKYPELYFKDDHFFSVEKEQQQLTNEFVLFASGKHPEYEAAYQQFKTKWNQGQVYDGALKRYLDTQAGDNWETPLRINNRQVPLGKYFETTDITNIHHINRRFRKYYTAAGILLVASSILLLSGKPLLQKLNNKNFPLLTTDNNQPFILNFQLQADSCVKDTADITGQLITHDSSYPLIFTNGQASTSLPYSKLDAATITLAWKNNTQQITTGVSFASSNTILQLKGNCPPPVPDKPLTVYIRYNNNLYASLMSSFIRAQSGRYTLIADQQDFSDSSRVIYYSKKDSLAAALLANNAASAFGVTVRTEYIEENRNPPAVPLLFLNLRRNSQCQDVAIGAMSRNLQEIWKGGTSNRLCRVDLDQQLIYYSTGDKNTYGTYRITEVCAVNGVYRVITKATTDYKIFFIRNISSDGFDLSMCQNNYTLAQAQNIRDTSYCDHFNRMRLYYEEDSIRTYVPYDAKNYTPTQKDKITSVSSSGQRYELEGVTICVNATNFPGTEKRELLIQNGLVNQSGFTAAFKDSWRSQPFKGTPFDRDYLFVRRHLIPGPSSKVPSTPDPCTTTYTSIATAEKAIGLDKICRLNLSSQRLEQVPAELGKLGNLQYLDIRNNYLTDKDSIRLYTMLPKTRILFYPQQQSPSQEVSGDWTSIGQLELDKRFTPVKKQKLDPYDLGRQLATSYFRRIKITAYYSNEKEMDEAQKKAMIVKDYILKNAASKVDLSDKIVTETKLLNTSSNQMMQQRSANNNLYVEIFAEYAVLKK